LAGRRDAPLDCLEQAGGVGVAGEEGADLGAQTSELRRRTRAGDSQPVTGDDVCAHQPSERENGLIKVASASALSIGDPRLLRV